MPDLILQICVLKHHLSCYDHYDYKPLHHIDDVCRNTYSPRCESRAIYQKCEEERGGNDSERMKHSEKRYNDGTVRWTQYFANYAHSVAEGLFYEHKESPGDYDQPMLYYEWIGRISHLALYRNADELLLTDPYLVWPLAKESGGSYGLWASRIHAQSSLGDETYGELMAYLDETDALLDALDEARQG